MNTLSIQPRTIQAVLVAGLLGLLAACGGGHADGDHGHSHDDDHSHADGASDDHAHDEETGDHDHDHDEDEGRTVIAADMAAAMGVRTAIVQTGTIAEELTLYGRIQPDAERLRAVTARFPGMVQEVAVQVGATVHAGQVLATVESNESLRSYPVTAPIGGIVVKRAINPGEMAGSEALFEIANFDSVWAELSVFPRDRSLLRTDQIVQVLAADGGAGGSGRLSFISALGSANQTLVARVVLANTDGSWTPGQFVNARVTVAESAPTLVVPLTALQTFHGSEVVALNEGDEYQLQPVKTGRRDATHAEVLEGLSPGARIVVANSYLVKADVEKSGASHEH